MKNKRFRNVMLLVTAVLMLIACFGCGENKEGKSSGKKNQVVHPGETVQYGDLEISFDELLHYYKRVYQSGDPTDDYQILLYPVLTINNNGQKRQLSFSQFTAYCDGTEIKTEYGKDSYDLTLETERSGQLIFGADVFPCYKKTNSMPETLDFDFSLPEYADQWGKLTFRVDLGSVDFSNDSDPDRIWNIAYAP